MSVSPLWCSYFISALIVLCSFYTVTMFDFGVGAFVAMVAVVFAVSVFWFFKLGVFANEV